MWNEDRRQADPHLAGQRERRRRQTAIRGWTNDCDVVLVTPERLDPISNSAISAPGIDDVMAEESGDIYFYSPEHLDRQQAGRPRRAQPLRLPRRRAAVRRRLRPGHRRCSRMQISPTGSFAALLTELAPDRLRQRRLQGDVHLRRRPTRLDPLRLVQPERRRPCNDVEASSGGPVHGRRRPRLLRDQGRARSARPQRRDHRRLRVRRRPAAADHHRRRLARLHRRRRMFSLLGDPQNIGLESVSADGTDVYFSTYETLVAGRERGLRQVLRRPHRRRLPQRTRTSCPAPRPTSATAPTAQPPPPPTVATGRQPRLRRQLPAAAKQDEEEEAQEEGKKAKKGKRKTQAQRSREAQQWLTSDG